MKKDYSSLFDHYDGLQYDNNVHAMIKVHELMEKAGIHVSALTKDKLAAYSDNRPFKVNYFISKVGKKLKWCPTNSADKLAKMNLKPAEWFIQKLSDSTEPIVKLPENWLEKQADFAKEQAIKFPGIQHTPISVKIKEEDFTLDYDVTGELSEKLKIHPEPVSSSILEEYDASVELTFKNDDLPF